MVLVPDAVTCRLLVGVDHPDQGVINNMLVDTFWSQRACRQLLKLCFLLARKPTARGRLP